MELVFQQDNYQMNWFRQDFDYAKVVCPDNIQAKVQNTREGDLLYTELLFKNETGKPVFTSLTDIGIYFPLQDQYESSQICIRERCHTHIFCGGEISYLMALRMGGEAPHLGMLLTQGSLGGYSVVRDISRMSNDRGCFILHPSPMELAPGQEKRLCWTVFPHQGKTDFEEKIFQMRNFVKAQASHYVIFPEETGVLTIKTSFEAKCVTIDGREISKKDGCYTVTYEGGEGRGEKVFHINADGISTFCRIYRQERLETLAEKRCRFLTEKQQYHGKEQGLLGAFLIYDNEEKHCFYGARNDDNAGRERVGMGLALAEYLQAHKGESGYEKLHESLKEYVSFVTRELVDVETGDVFNDYGRDDSYERLYNMPWYATLFVELYQLYGKPEHLTSACRIVNRFYEKGGFTHYAIELPVLSLCRELERAGRDKERERMTELFRKHADRIAETGLDYPPFEVNYEQSIVAPAVNILLQTAVLTGEEAYLKAGKKQLEILELFNGRQPDYHLYETAIRHWDGYWFGKRRLYGDTFPHYWSALTGSCYQLYYHLTGEKAYAVKAEASLRSVLTLLLPDGSASCAYVFPVTVNGVKAEGYDPYANDQDWALYFYLRSKREGERLHERKDL